jgi:hypothetical protein
MEHVGHGRLCVGLLVVVRVGDRGQGRGRERELVDPEVRREVDFLVRAWHEVARVDALGRGDEVGAVDGAVAGDVGLRLGERAVSGARLGAVGGVVVRVQRLESGRQRVGALPAHMSRLRRGCAHVGPVPELIRPGRGRLFARVPAVPGRVAVAVRVARVAAEALVAVAGAAEDLLVVGGVAKADAGRVAVDRAPRAGEVGVPGPVFFDGAAGLAEVLEVGAA